MVKQQEYKRIHLVQLVDLFITSKILTKWLIVYLFWYVSSDVLNKVMYETYFCIHKTSTSVSVCQCMRNLLLTLSCASSSSSYLSCPEYYLAIFQ